MSRAIDDLLHEHEAIGHALRILAVINQKLATNSSVDAGDLTAFVGFFKEFADKCHHGKEEGLLFPAVGEAAAQEAGPVLEELLAEHAQGRRWMASMSAAIEPHVNAGEFIQAAQGYAQLLQAHIAKENEVLFPLAQRVLPADRLEALYEGFEAHEAEVIGAGRHEQLHALLKSLKAKYAS